MKFTKTALVAMLTTFAFAAPACDKKEEAKKEDKKDAKKDEKKDDKKAEEKK